MPLTLGLSPEQLACYRFLNGLDAEMILYKHVGTGEIKEIKRGYLAVHTRCCFYQPGAYKTLGIPTVFQHRLGQETLVFDTPNLSWATSSLGSCDLINQQLLHVSVDEYTAPIQLCDLLIQLVYNDKVPSPFEKLDDALQRYRWKIHLQIHDRGALNFYTMDMLSAGLPHLDQLNWLTQFVYKRALSFEAKDALRLYGYTQALLITLQHKCKPIKVTSRQPLAKKDILLQSYEHTEQLSMYLVLEPTEFGTWLLDITPAQDSTCRIQPRPQLYSINTINPLNDPSISRYCLARR